MKVVVRIVAALSLWALVGVIVLLVDPDSVRDVGLPGAYLPFFVPFFLAMWYSITIIFGNILSALVITLLLILAVVLRMFQLLNLYLSCVIAALIFFTIYIQKRH